MVILLAVFVTITAARWADGPWALIAGGPFTTGTLSATPPDPAALKDVAEVQFQLESTGRSRTSWIMENNGRLFIPSGYMNTPQGKIWKHWPMDAEKDGRIILRVDGVLYEMNMVRVMDDPDLGGAMAEVGRKYLPGATAEFGLADVASGNTWVFELLPR